MKVENSLHIILFIFCTVTACNSKPTSGALQKGVHITLSADSSAVELHDVEPDVLDYLHGDSISEKEWKSFFSVYPETADPELRDLQSPLEGSYFLKDSIIVFVPKNPFKKDSVYFARSYRPNVLAKPSDVISTKGLSRQTIIAEQIFKR